MNIGKLYFKNTGLGGNLIAIFLSGNFFFEKNIGNCKNSITLNLL